MRANVILPTLALIGSMLAPGCGGQPRSTVIPNATDFAITFPKDWDRSSGLQSASVQGVSPKTNDKDVFREFVKVVVQEVPPSATAAQLEASGTQGLEQMLKDGKIVERADATLGGRPARRVVFTHRIDPFRIKACSWIAVSGMRGYVVTCTALEHTWDQYEPTFNEIIKSFKFK